MSTPATFGTLVLDSEALSRLARTPGRTPAGVVHAALAAAHRLRADVVLPAAVLAEQYRGGVHDAAIDRWLAANKAVIVVATDAAVAKQVGHLLAAARRGSKDHVDATVIAAAIRAVGKSLVVTSDPKDLTALTGGASSIHIVAV